MEVYKVGQVLEGFKNRPDSVLFDVTDNGAVMIILLDNPLQEEIEQFKMDKSFEMRLTEIDNVIMITAKIGKLSWMDAPYNPHLSKSLTHLHTPDEGSGLGLMLMLVDTRTGKIKHIRLLGLSYKFTMELYKAIQKEKEKKFDNTKYNRNINRIFLTYTTEQIVDMAEICYKEKGTR